jgi:hypothetical protein
MAIDRGQDRHLTINGLTREMCGLRKRAFAMRRCLTVFHFPPFLLSFLLSIAATIATAPKLSAQGSADIDRAQLTQSQQPSPFVPGSTPEGVQDGHVAPSPNDADLGEQEILKRSERYQPFTASVSLPIYWTSNVALTKNNENSDVIEAPTAGLYYEPRFTRTFYGLIDVREQLFYYDKYDSFNFGAFDIDVGLSYFLPQLDNLTLRLAYNYDRLTTKDSFDDFFSNHALIFNAEVPFRFGRAQQLTVGAGANISLTAEPEPPRRNDYEAYVGYAVALTRSFSVNGLGRLVVRDYYHQDSRTDISEILSVTANYRVTKFLTASALSSFAASQSNHGIFDYEVANVGGAIALSIKF